MTELIIWFLCGLASLLIFLIACIFIYKEITRKDALTSIFIFLTGPVLIVVLAMLGVVALLIVAQQKLFEKFNIHMPKIDLDKTVWKRK